MFFFSANLQNLIWKSYKISEEMRLMLQIHSMSSCETSHVKLP